MDAKITNSNENKANPGNYSTQGFTGDPLFPSISRVIVYGSPSGDHTPFGDAVFMV